MDIARIIEFLMIRQFIDYCMQYVISIHLLVFLGLKFLLVVNKRMNFTKKVHDTDDNAAQFPQAELSTVLTNRHLMCEKENMMSLFFNLALHLKIRMVMKSFFV